MVKQQPFMDKFLLISSDYLYWLLHNLIFCNMGVCLLLGWLLFLEAFIFISVHAT